MKSAQHHTARLILRPFIKEDAANLYAMDSDPRVHRYLGNKPMTHISQAEKTIEMVQQQYESYGIGRWALLLKENHSFLGWAGLKYETQMRSVPFYDVGYRLKYTAWGNGYATEASKYAVKFGFEELKLKKLNGAAHIENKASNRILQKIGMRFIEVFEPYGIESNWYELLKEDYS